MPSLERAIQRFSAQIYSSLDPKMRAAEESLTEGFMDNHHWAYNMEPVESDDTDYLFRVTAKLVPTYRFFNED